MNKEEMKQVLIDAWKTVFNTDTADDSSDFFEAGGDSISAVQIHGWMLQKGVKIDLVKFYTNPTIGELAEFLEETQPMYVPEKLLTKDIVKEEYGIDMKNNNRPVRQAIQNRAAVNSAPANNQTGSVQDQRLCDPNMQDQRLCDPNMQDQRLCDPNMQDQRLCDPNMQDQRLCDPNMQDQRLCDPNMQDQRLCDPNMQGYRPWNQQQFMPQYQPQYPPQYQVPIFQFIFNVPQGQYPMYGQPAPYPQYPYAPAPRVGKRVKDLIKERKKIMDDMNEKYAIKPVDKAIENPNVMQVKKPEIAVPTMPPEQALAETLQGIKPDYDKNTPLTSQGFSNMDLMKIITRVGERGYRLGIGDIAKNPTFDAIVGAMIPGGEEKN